MSSSVTAHRTLCWFLLALVVSTPLTACARYVPVQTESRPMLEPIAEGTAIRVQLTEAGRAAVAPTIGPDMATLAGRTGSSRGDSLVLQVSRTWHVSGYDETRRGETVVLAPSHVQGSDRREWSVWRSVLLGAAIGTVAVGLRTAVIKSGGAGGLTGGEGGGTPP
jgi:hypothetical protein